MSGYRRANIPWLDIFLTSALSPRSFAVMIVLLVGWSTSTDAGRPRLLIAKPMPLPWIYKRNRTLNEKSMKCVKWNEPCEFEPDFGLEVRLMHAELHDFPQLRFQHVEPEWIGHFDWLRRCHYLIRRSKFVRRHRHDATVDFCDNSRWPEQSSRRAYSCWRWALGAWAPAMVAVVQSSFAGMWFVPDRWLSVVKWNCIQLELRARSLIVYTHLVYNAIRCGSGGRIITFIISGDWRSSVCVIVCRCQHRWWWAQLGFQLMTIRTILNDGLTNLIASL